MDRDELRARQAPLKARFREDPDAAITPVSAVAVLGRGATAGVRTHQGIVDHGLHTATWGDGYEA